MSAVQTTPIGGRTRLGGIGESVQRPDAIPKVTGDFAFSSDLRHDRMLWGGTLRSPHPSARISSIGVVRHWP